jgi:threonine/homoserine/homoserine lactone efflux protein
MNAFVGAWPSLAAFLITSLVLAATPGPGVVYIVTRTLEQGRRTGLAAVAGVALGNLGNAIGAAVGLADVLAVSPVTFTVVKLAGAAYLVYLGLRALRRPDAPATTSPKSSRKIAHIFRDGLLVALLNPKTALFFAAFLPQFISPTGSAIVQSALLGTTFVLIAACTDCIYVVAAAAAAPAISNVGAGGALGRYATAAVFVGLGLFAAASGGRGLR